MFWVPAVVRYLPWDEEESSVAPDAHASAATMGNRPAVC